MGSGSLKLNDMRVCAERYGHLLDLLIVGGFGLLAISSWRGDGVAPQVKLIRL